MIFGLHLQILNTTAMVPFASDSLTVGYPPLYSLLFSPTGCPGIHHVSSLLLLGLPSHVTLLPEYPFCSFLNLVMAH